MFRPGDEVTILPSGITTRNAHIEEGGRPIDVAFSPMNVTYVQNRTTGSFIGALAARGLA